MKKPLSNIFPTNKYLFLPTDIHNFTPLKKTFKFFQFSSESLSTSMNSTKLEGDLQLILGLLCHFLLTNINFSKFFYYNLYLFKFVRILAKEKILLISIQDPTMPKIYQKRNPILGNINSCLCHRCKGHFISFTSNWYFFENEEFFYSQVFSLVHLHQKLVQNIYPNWSPHQHQCQQKNFQFL